MIPFIVNDRGATVVVKNKSFTISRKTTTFNKVFEAIRNGANESEVYDIINAVKDINSYINNQNTNRVNYINGKVYVDGEELHNTIVERLNSFSKMDLPIKHLLKFIDNISNNTSYNSKKQLFSFLENHDLVLTEDGCFLGYKAVRPDFMDKYTGKISNHIGANPKMSRSDIDDNPDNHCSKGLHVAALNYAKNIYGSCGDKIVLVKVNPKDVVSVPNDYNCQKCRVSEYVVIGEVKDELTEPLYTSTGEPFSAEYKYDDNWDFADDIYAEAEEEDYIYDPCEEESDCETFYDDDGYGV